MRNQCKWWGKNNECQCFITMSGKPIYCDGFHATCFGRSNEIFAGGIIDRFFLPLGGKQLRMDLNVEKSQMEFAEKVKV